MTLIHHFIMIHSAMKYAGKFPLVRNVQEAAELVLGFHIKSEFIGNWLYCFTNPIIGCQLEALGFWYSYKHVAFIFSGSPKEVFADDETLDEIRKRLGSTPVV